MNGDFDVTQKREISVEKPIEKRECRLGCGCLALTCRMKQRLYLQVAADNL